MLPPQLRGSIHHPLRHQTLVTHALKASSTSALHARSFWSWRRDWASHLDPAFHKFSRVRTLKTRAKLLKSLRRRGKFEWDFDTKPFFTPRFVRHASHWDASGRRKGYIYDPQDSKKSNESGEVSKTRADEDGFELSAREKEWRERMEGMRKRIEKDPYEAVFGKRFEPFWSPLVPSWMREEMGLQGWPKTQKDTPKETPPATHDASTTTLKNVTADKANTKPSDSDIKKETSVISKSKTEQKPISSRSNSYAYASSTSWDSWSNKTKRVEWDSVSDQTRKFEYDPISNRMVQVEALKPAAVEQKVIKPLAPASTSAEPLTKNIPIPESTRKPIDSKAVNIPVKQSSELRKSIPIPPPLSQPSHSIPLGFGGCTITSIGPLRSTALASDVLKPSALATLPEKPAQQKPEKDVETLTADSIRAAVRKAKDPTPAASVTPVESLQSFLDASGKTRMHAFKPSTSQWDQAEWGVMLEKELETLARRKEKLLTDEDGLFHIERQKKELQKLDERIKEVTARVEKLNVVAAAPPTTQSPAQSSSRPAALQSSLDRMQSKTLPEAVVEPDDSAAHESTEPLPANNFASVPRNWAQQADLLQADRVRRTSPKQPYPIPIKRWAEDMEARKAAHEAAQAAAALESGKADEEAERKAKLEKANSMLEAEVADIKIKMQAHESRYAHKIRSLRTELEEAYKTSAVHAGEHLDRVRWLEAELAKAQKAAGGEAKGPVAVESKLVSDSAKRRAVEKSEQKAKDNALVKEVREIYEGTYGVIDAEHRQPLLTETEAKDAVRRWDWNRIEQTSRAYRAELKNAQLKRAEKKQRAEQVKTPDVKVVEVESNVDLGEALARYEKETPAPHKYPSSQRALENQVAAEERAATEAQGEHTSANLPNAPQPTPASSTSTTLPPTVQWQSPPVYKILAYDSGNDMMSTAITTSNFTGSEAPISIPQALSQLYQPARFVPHFAELQREGYQVIHGTKDLLVFKKVLKETVGSEAESGRPRSEGTTTSNEATDLAAMPSLATTSETAPTSVSNAGEFPPLQEEDQDIIHRHYPRVRRMEQHFTGSRRRWNTHHHRQHKAGLEWMEQVAKQRRSDRKRRFRWILGAGVGMAGVSYLVGSAVEKARAREAEEWERKARDAREMEKKWWKRS